MSSERPVRLATMADVGEIEMLVQRAYAPFVEIIGRQPAPMTDDYAQLVAGGVVHVIEGERGLDGLVVMWPQNDHFYIDNVAVDPVRQRHGVGFRLLRHADEVAAAAGHCEIRLYTNEAMAENVDFYERRGYAETHRAVDDGYRRIHFRRLLDVPH